MRGIVEKPGEKVCWGVDEGGEDGNEREIREGGTEVATGKKDEADIGERGGEAMRVLFSPTETGEDVHYEREGVEAGDEEEERDERETEVEQDEDGGEAGEGDNRAAGAVASEAEKMDELGDEEGDEAEFGGVVEGEDNIGDTSCEHGGEKEIIFREDFGDIKEAEGDTSDAEEGEEIMLGSENAEDDVDEKERKPEGEPDCGDFRAGRLVSFLVFRAVSFLVLWMVGWIFWRSVFLMGTIRSRN